ncbi:MAG: U32 family peptidase [Alistipes sp.]|nr:U32 family peptidase [Alistipes sp.]
MKKPEILAPAGSMEALTAALRTGADAVYLGGKKYSARNSAANFGDEELKEAAFLCHSHGAKLYLAVNTLISDGELTDLAEYIIKAAAAGVDAFIVQDLGASRLIRELVPDACIHGSTQMSVHTASGAELLREMGFSRVVPARELDEETLAAIAGIDIETEVFVHGALCMSVSGQCYMSAMIGSRSANRGCCGQACRLPFSAVGNREKAALSLKDLSLLEHTGRLTDIGVDSLKIEGRMKRPEYVAAAVSELKKALDGGSPDMAMLRGIFSRDGFTDGYFSGKRQDMFGVREKDDVIAAREIIPNLHELYRRERAAFTANFHVRMIKDMPLEITASVGNISAAVSGDIPDAARNAPTDAAALTKQLSKLGDTVFTFGAFTAEIENGLFVPAGKLNELRRRLTAELTLKIAESNTPEYKINSFSINSPKAVSHRKTADLPLRTYCRTKEQVLAAVGSSQFVIIPESIADAGLPKDKVIVAPPRFIANEEKTISRLNQLKDMGFEHLLCHTLDSAAMGKKLGFRLHGGFTLNIFNSLSAEAAPTEDVILSPELTAEQISEIGCEKPAGALIYGRLPLMLTRNCPIKNEVGCQKCTGCITDRTARQLPVACSGDYVELLNPDILYMGDRLNELGGISFGVIMLHDENADETRAAMLMNKPHGNITRGLYYRGVCNIK